MGCDPDKSYGVKCSLPSITKGGLAMGLPNGIHHLAICTKDIKKQIEFFTQVCGMELVALYWMHGVKNTFHGFVKLGDSSSIAFVQGPEVGEIQPIKGVSHDAWTGSQVAAGGMTHLAMNVDNEAAPAAIPGPEGSPWVLGIGPTWHGICKTALPP